MRQEILQYDPDIGYTYIPALKARIPHETGGYLISTNGLGFRSPPVDDATDHDILVFGDSFTAGDGVSDGKRWTDLLVPAVAPARVHNFGLPGTGTDQQYLAWRKFGADRPCALVVVAVLVENVKRITAAYRPVDAGGDSSILFKAKPYFTLDEGSLVRHHDPVPVEPVDPVTLGDATVDRGGRHPILRRLVNKLGLKTIVQQMTAYQPVPDYDAADTAGWQLMLAILTRWSNECASPMVIVPLPLYQHVEGTADASAYQARFAELGAALDRPVIDPLSALRSYSGAERRGFRFDRDVHLTPSGHRAVADAIASPIVSLLKATK